ncbi:hypothetical protein Tter_1185 [Thermobaculum terrenum ATCC BAA-798]|uniref:Uncharacterized protein n=1 Tax=Thermobaculum terrenum (strain ATCC BAA-798 / CCMEE 7001 / YNP1) TaxID=525904 RepID=D1CBC8_THET1|nr:hypothetical protein [Thermobaculum terrenum]ACZ42093.1 hypothetical protein Tter_1185 [Thermobaculum terrenum ATCC BAA-798]
MRRFISEDEPLTPEEEEVGRLLAERYPDVARLLLAAADITHLSYDQKKNTDFLMKLSGIAADVLVSNMPAAEANEYVLRKIEVLKAELRENMFGPQTGPWAQGKPPRI